MRLQLTDSSSLTSPFAISDTANERNLSAHADKMPPCRDKGKINAQKLQRIMNGALVTFVCEIHLSSRVFWNVGQLWHALFAQICKYFLVKCKKHRKTYWSFYMFMYNVHAE